MLLWIGQCIASIGTGLSTFSLGVYAFQLARSALDSSLVLLIGFLPGVILLLPSGVLADKYDRRLLMILGDGLSSLGILFILLVKIYFRLDLIHIYLGLFISSIFSSLMQPAYRATVTDLLSEKDYTKASGMIQMASSAKFLFSPFLAGFLLKRYNLEFLLFLDICTVAITVAISFSVRKSLTKGKTVAQKDSLGDLSAAWKILRADKDVFKLTAVAGGLTFFIGILQALSGPYILSYSNAKNLGLSLSLSSLGMFISAFILGLIPLRKNFIRLLSASLFFAGLFMASYGLGRSFFAITLSGFLFFACLPIADACMDYLIRSNIDNNFQGRIWAFIGFISQIGYAVAYPFAGFVADKIFTPALNPEGFLFDNVGRIWNMGSGGGIGLAIFLAGIGLASMALWIRENRAIKTLESSTKRGGLRVF